MVMAAVTMSLWISLQPFHFMSNFGQLVYTHASVIKRYPLIWYWPKSTGAVWWEGSKQWRPSVVVMTKSLLDWLPTDWDPSSSLCACIEYWTMFTTHRQWHMQQHRSSSWHR